MLLGLLMMKGKTAPLIVTAMQAFWSQLWQFLIAMLAVAILMLALQKDNSKLPVYSGKASNVQRVSVPSNGSHPVKLQ